MVTMLIVTISFCAFCTIIQSFVALKAIEQLEKQRNEWRDEREKLLDRIQAGSFAEFKAQGRADAPVKRKEINPEVKKWEDKPWA